MKGAIRPGKPHRPRIIPTALIRRRHAKRWHIEDGDVPGREQTTCGQTIYEPARRVTTYADEVGCEACMVAVLGMMSRRPRTVPKVTP